MLVLVLAIPHGLIAHRVPLEDTRTQSLSISLQPPQCLLGPNDTISPRLSLPNRRVTQDTDQAISIHYLSDHDANEQHVCRGEPTFPVLEKPIRAPSPSLAFLLHGSGHPRHPRFRSLAQQSTPSGICLRGDVSSSGCCYIADQASRRTHMSSVPGMIGLPPRA